jgi:hypothetical protein
VIEIIKRQEGQKHEKERIGEGYRPQVSYNDSGHLVLRLIPQSKRGEGSPDADILIVFGGTTTERIIRFCQEYLRNWREINGIPW